MEQMTEFETGALRGAKEVPADWYLLSPIGLRQVAAICKHREFDRWSNFSPLDLVGFAIDAIWDYWGGKRDQPYLAIALRHVMYACDVRECSESQVENRRRFWESWADESAESTGIQFLPYTALKHIAMAYAEGAVKYGVYNYLYGFPIQNLISHALDHLWSICAADGTEDHWGHAMWNLLTAIHFQETRPDLFTNMLSDYYHQTNEIHQQLKRHRDERAARSREDAGNLQRSRSDS